MIEITIDGIDLPSPTKYRIPKFDIDSSDTNRNELGILQRDRIRQGVFKIELEWKMLTSSELHLIETAVKPDKINVTFDTPTGKQTKQMYVGDRNIEGIAFEGTDKMRWHLSFNLTEY